MLKTLRSIEEKNKERQPLYKRGCNVSFQNISVIIPTELKVKQEKMLIKTLRSCQKTIGWSIEDLKGISPLIYTHHWTKELTWFTNLKEHWVLICKNLWGLRWLSSLIPKLFTLFMITLRVDWVMLCQRKVVSQ